MNSESLTNVLTRQWRIVTGSKTVNPRNRMPETGASGSVGAPLEESGALPGTGSVHLLSLHESGDALCPAPRVACSQTIIISQLSIHIISTYAVRLRAHIG